MEKIEIKDYTRKDDNFLEGRLKRIELAGPDLTIFTMGIEWGSKLREGDLMGATERFRLNCNVYPDSEGSKVRYYYETKEHESAQIYDVTKDRWYVGGVC